MTERERELTKDIPENPGCYLMKDSSDTVIYIGKAKNLKKRVQSYFLSGKNLKTEALSSKIQSIEVVITGNEYEALILENNLIKEYSPRYNILLKDGKSYPLIRITKEDFPRILKTRRIIKDGSLYFGPYPSASKLDTYLNLVYESYPIRVCKGPLPKKNIPCVYYHIKKCSAPCMGYVTKEKYREWVREVEEFLKGDDSSLIKRLKKEMEDASKNLDFETAAIKRDQINALSVLSETQSVEDFSQDSRDYFAIEMRGVICAVSVMQFRSGRLIGKALYRAECLSDENETLLSFLVQYYGDGEELPAQIFLSDEIDTELFGKYFEREFSKNVYISHPREGKHYRILMMGRENARRDAEKRLRAVDNSAALERLKEQLKLDRIPSYIEGFDIAELEGKYPVASLIVFRDGNPSKSEYRYFSIKTLDGKIDDFQAMREAVARRYTKLVNQGETLPDLIMVDGGIGQVNAALEIMGILSLNVPVVGLAKENEEIVFPGGKRLVLDKADPALRVLIALRNECHRFATSFNKRMRSKEASFSLLESIDGVGPERSRKIMTMYKSVDNIITLSAEELSKGAKIPLTVAARILKKLRF